MYLKRAFPTFYTPRATNFIRIVAKCLQSNVIDISCPPEYRVSYKYLVKEEIYNRSYSRVRGL